MECPETTFILTQVIYMSQQPEKKRREPEAIDDGKLRLYGAPQKEGARQTMIRVKLDSNNNNPIIEVDFGYKTEPKAGKSEGFPVKIDTPMAPIPFRTLMNLIIRVANYNGEVSFEVDNWGFPFMWDADQRKSVRAKEKMIISRFQVAKREDGVVTFGITAKGKPDMVHEFKSDEYHMIMQNGQPVDVKISSREAAIATAEAWLEVYYERFTNKWEEPEYQKKRRLENMQKAQGGGGGYQQRNNNGGGGGGNNYQQRPPQQQQQQAPAPLGDGNGFDDDIPF